MTTFITSLLLLAVRLHVEVVPVQTETVIQPPAVAVVTQVVSEEDPPGTLASFRVLIHPEQLPSWAQLVLRRFNSSESEGPPPVAETSGESESCDCDTGPAENIAMSGFEQEQAGIAVQQAAFARSLAERRARAQRENRLPREQSTLDVLRNELRMVLVSAGRVLPSTVRQLSSGEFEFMTVGTGMAAGQPGKVQTFRTDGDIADLSRMMESEVTSDDQNRNDPVVSSLAGSR